MYIINGNFDFGVARARVSATERNAAARVCSILLHRIMLHAST